MSASEPMATGADAPEEAAPGVAELVDLARTHRLAVLTGAGISTESGIPDYRSPGRPVRTPMTWQEFSGSPERRRRYWAGAAVGWPKFDRARPNRGHLALAALERAGIVTGVATQNIDGLHALAGSERVIELHGHLRSVRCTACGRTEPREELLARMRESNPMLRDVDERIEGNPDGDATLPTAFIEAFRVPVCRQCGGMLAPQVVMFGQLVDERDTLAAAELVDDSDALLVVGSSLAVNTGLRLVHRARRRNRPVAIVNRGPTAADRLATIRVSGGTGAVLERLARTVGVDA